MSTLTPASRRDEATDAASWEGIMNGGLMLIPSMGAVYAAMQNPAFIKRTNWQSRTAMAIMPALFVFTLTAEKKHNHKMREIAEESSHAQRTVQWAEKQQQQRSSSSAAANREKEQSELSQLYRHSVLESGVRVVPGNQLSFHHVASNYAAANPIKVLAALAVPSVAWIFYGRTGKQHLSLNFMILHTRVFGQFATISLMLGVMGFKEWMDSHGKYITQAEADARVEEMKRVRERLQAKLDRDRETELAYKREIEQAHEEDMKSGSAKSKKKNKKATEDVNNAINTIKE